MGGEAAAAAAEPPAAAGPGGAAAPLGAPVARPAPGMPAPGAPGADSRPATSRCLTSWRTAWWSDWWGSRRGTPVTACHVGRGCGGGIASAPRLRDRARRVQSRATRMRLGRHRPGWRTGHVRRSEQSRSATRQGERTQRGSSIKVLSSTSSPGRTTWFVESSSAGQVDP